MKLWKNVVVVAAAVIATALITERVVSQESPDDAAARERRDPQREAWLAHAAPGVEHARLARWAGTWRQEQTYWMYPGAVAQTATATATFKPILGGRFVREHVKSRGEVAGDEERFIGYGWFGYDNYTRKHVFAWIDNQGTMMLTGAGERDDRGAIVYSSTVPNPVTGGVTEIRSIAREAAGDTLVFELHERLPDGTWFRKMTATSTREP